MANYDVGIFTGHGRSRDGSYDPGACNGSKQEHQVARRITDKVVELLRSNGYNVQYEQQNYKDNWTNGNKYRLNYCLSVHLNASPNGTGAEMLVPCGEKNFDIEDRILRGLSQLGLQNRGKKSRDYDTDMWLQRAGGIKLNYKDWFGEIRNAWGQGTSLSILETGFISNNNDLAIVENHIEDIAYLIADSIAHEDHKRIIKQTSTPQKPPQADTKGVFYRVVTGSFKDKNNAEQRVDVLRSIGYDSFIDTQSLKGYYRVVTGSFSSKDNANKRADELSKKGYTSFIEAFKK